LYNVLLVPFIRGNNIINIKEYNNSILYKAARFVKY